MSAKMRKLRKPPPDGWELIEPTLEEFDQKMREAETDEHEGKRKVECLWPIFRIHHQKSRYIYELFYKRKAISRELYEYCLEAKIADAALIAKWKKAGYEALCCLRCIQVWIPIFRIHHHKSRYIYELFYKRKAISRELYEYCLEAKIADAALITKWKKAGYEALCCLRCIQVWIPIFRIHHHKSRYIYELFYKRKAISRELYEYCLEAKIADAALIAKWKKAGYEALCCLRCIQTKDTNFGTNCICRVPKAKLDAGRVIECIHCGCRGCSG